MTDLVPMPPTVAPEITGIAQISASQAGTLPPGRYYFAYARNLRIDQWPKFAISDLGPAIDVIATESFNAVDVYNNPETAQAGGQRFNTLYMTDQFPDKLAPVHWKAVNTIGLCDPTSPNCVKSMLTVALLTGPGVYDAPTLNNILQTNQIITNTIQTKGHSTAATGIIQITPIGVDIRSLGQASPTDDNTLWLWIIVAVVVVVLGIIWTLVYNDAIRSAICPTGIGQFFSQCYHIGVGGFVIALVLGLGAYWYSSR